MIWSWRKNIIPYFYCVKYVTPLMVKIEWWNSSTKAFWLFLYDAKKSNPLLFSSKRSLGHCPTFEYIAKYVSVGNLSRLKADPQLGFIPDSSQTFLPELGEMKFNFEMFWSCRRGSRGGDLPEWRGDLRLGRRGAPTAPPPQREVHAAHVRRWNDLKQIVFFFTSKWCFFYLKARFFFSWKSRVFLSLKKENFVHFKLKFFFSFQNGIF